MASKSVSKESAKSLIRKNLNKSLKSSNLRRGLKIGGLIALLGLAGKIGANFSSQKRRLARQGKFVKTKDAFDLSSVKLVRNKPRKRLTSR